MDQAKKPGVDSAASEQAAPGEDQRRADLGVLAGPLRYAIGLVLQHPAEFGRLLLLHLIAGSLPLLLLGIDGTVAPGQPGAILVLLLVAPAAWTTLVATRLLLDGAPRVDLIECTKVWAARLPGLATVSLLVAGVALLLARSVDLALGALPTGPGLSNSLVLLVNLLLLDRGLALGLLAVPALLFEGVSPPQALARSWRACGWPGWTLWVAATLLLASALLTSVLAFPALRVLEAVRGHGPPGNSRLVLLALAALPAWTLQAMTWACLDEARRDPEGPRMRWGGAVARGLVVVFLAAWLLPGYRSARRQANQRACFANQSEIAGALEMYSLDNRVPWLRYGAEAAEFLMSRGYMDNSPWDPGNSHLRAGGYASVPRGEDSGWVFFFHHGPRDLEADESRAISVRELLRRRDVSDPELLARANAERMDGWMRPRYRGPPGVVLGLGAVLGVPGPLPMIAVGGRLGGPGT